MNRAPASHSYFSQRLRLHYIDWGNEGAPVMLLVHGLHDHCRTWDDLAAHFADDYHVVAPDLRGHGDSQWLRGSAYQYLDYIYDLHQLIVQADLGPVVLVGHSLGGAIAAMFAGVYPELVSRLVLIEAIGRWGLGQPPVPVHLRIQEWVENTRALAARLPRRYQDLSEAYQRMQQANPQLRDEQALHLTVHGSNQNEDGTYSWKYDNYTFNFSPGSISQEEIMALWRRVACPTLVMVASHGLEHRIGHDDTMQYFDDGQLVKVTPAGHWTYHDQPMVVAGHLQSFLKPA